ncbi:MAG: VanZ family protein [Acidobacteria bacterium]|nr:VanZ family protein [Acidobacteriota bacterium]
MALIFGTSSIPNLQHLPGDVSDKTAHFAAYAVLAALLLWGTSNVRWAGVGWRSGLLAIAGAAAYGVFDELHQAFVPGRSTSFDDWVADVSGASAAVLVLAAIARVLTRSARAV